MVPITIDEFIATTIKNNKNMNKSELKASLKEAVKKKKNGNTCVNCGSPIWAIGSAICGWNGCFSCIIGESDSSEDYEIDEVIE